MASFTDPKNSQQFIVSGLQQFYKGHVVIQRGTSNVKGRIRFMTMFTEIIFGGKNQTQLCGSLQNHMLGIKWMNPLNLSERVG